jgi:glycosyltransferase involved in cell wall biosynthesis
VVASKVKPILLGATLPDGIGEWHSHHEPLHFMFAGALRHLKAIDHILQAFRMLNAEGLQYRLSFVGGEGEPGWVEAISKTPNAFYLGSMSQVALYQQLAQADCLLLPSRYDSFGMVVAEAMACGTPAIVSTQTGAKAMIEQFPKAGWIVECDVEALYHCVKARIQNREELFAARAAALVASQEFTWQAYRKRVGLFIEEWMK